MKWKKMNLQLFADAHEQLQNTTGSSGMSAEMKQMWMRQCDARLRQTVVNRSACSDFDAVGADMAGDGLEYDTQLLAPDAFSALYQHWLCAQMDLALGETARAVNELQMYSDYCQEFAAWMRQKYPPAGGVQWRY